MQKTIVITFLALIAMHLSQVVAQPTRVQQALKSSIHKTSVA
jgi:hypothetical protein